MARITCSYSSITFNCEHMPLALSAREYHHPLFSVPKKRLVALAGEWAAGRLSPTESYLLYLSLLNSTDLIVWRAPATFTSKTLSIVANNMESLLHIIGKIDVINHPAFALPKFAITSDTCDLSNSYYWIRTWIENYNDWMDGYKHSDAETRKSLEIRETALQKLIKSPGEESTEELARILAEWASQAGDFPTSGTVPHPQTKKQIPLAEYWKQIIRACTSGEQIWKYPKTDLEELIAHCEDNIIHGSIYAHALMKHLRNGLKKHDDYLGLGNFDIGTNRTSFTILSAGADDVGAANIQAIINSAPSFEPKPSQYPTQLAYIKAKLKWQVASQISHPPK